MMNLFYLLAAILMITISLAHAIWGEKFILAELEETALNKITKTGFFISWHQITSTLFVCGIALLIIALSKNIPGTKNIALLIAAITFFNFMVFLISSLLKEKSILLKSIPQIIFFTAIITLILLGVLQ